ncbi:MAG: hypothetical protein R6X21_08605 [Candidatus Aminicenantes bacterium]
MAKILLVDFEDQERDFLASRKYDVELLSTGWRTGSEKPLDIPGGSDIVFYQVGAADPRGPSGLHAAVHEALVERVKEGVRVVCFVGGGETPQLTNIVGPIPGLRIEDSARADSVVFNPRALFHVPFERFRPFIAGAFRLLPDTLAEGIWEKETPTNGHLEVLAKSADGAPVAFLLRKGKGYILLLPSFGPKNVEVVDYILKDKLSLAAALPEEPVVDWLEGEDYVFPELKDLLLRKDQERRRYEAAQADIDRRISEMRSAGQEEFHRLLKAEGPALRSAVIHALRYLGWEKVVDVDDYWKKVIRSKEEDAWLVENAEQNVETSLRKESLIIVLVRGNKNWATDDECSLLQKYKGRRMQEFDNTRMKAVLVGNYFSNVEAKVRDIPFSAAQIEEAQKDGNGLMTTWELFKAVKAEKEKRVGKDALRTQLKTKTGLITLEY